jgi:hypothetical protein
MTKATNELNEIIRNAASSLLESQQRLQLLEAVHRERCRRPLANNVPPDDDTQLIVGIDKANAPPAHRQPSTGK